MALRLESSVACPMLASVPALTVRLLSVLFFAGDAFATYAVQSCCSNADCARAGYSTPPWYCFGADCPFIQPNWVSRKQGYCYCKPRTCDGACGVISDGCGGRINCGQCLSCSAYTSMGCWHCSHNPSNCQYCYPGAVIGRPETFIARCVPAQTAEICMGCVASCSAATCADFPGQCGVVDDGCNGVLDCACAAGQRCVYGNCCTPKTCSVLGCGQQDDGCGNIIQCPCCTCGPYCGTDVPDGCGNTLNCPCSTGMFCNASGVCQEVLTTGTTSSGTTSTGSSGTTSTGTTGTTSTGTTSTGTTGTSSTGTSSTGSTGTTGTTGTTGSTSTGTTSTGTTGTSSTGTSSTGTTDTTGTTGTTSTGTSSTGTTGTSSTGTTSTGTSGSSSSGTTGSVSSGTTGSSSSGTTGSSSSGTTGSSSSGTTGSVSSGTSGTTSYNAAESATSATTGPIVVATGIPATAGLPTGRMGAVSSGSSETTGVAGPSADGAASTLSATTEADTGVSSGSGVPSTSDPARSLSSAARPDIITASTSGTTGSSSSGSTGSLSSGTTGSASSGTTGSTSSGTSGSSSSGSTGSTSSGTTGSTSSLASGAVVTAGPTDAAASSGPMAAQTTGLGATVVVAPSTTSRRRVVRVDFSLRFDTALSLFNRTLFLELFSRELVISLDRVAIRSVRAGSVWVDVSVVQSGPTSADATSAEDAVSLFHAKHAAGSLTSLTTAIGPILDVTEPGYILDGDDTASTAAAVPRTTSATGAPGVPLTTGLRDGSSASGVGNVGDGAHDESAPSADAGVIVGVVVGVLAFAGLSVGVVLLWMRRRKMRHILRRVQTTIGLKTTGDRGSAGQPEIEVKVGSGRSDLNPLYQRD